MKTLDKMNLKNKLYIKYFKKADDVTVMNPKLDTYFSHSFHLIFFGFHSLIPFLKATVLVNSFKFQL